MDTYPTVDRKPAWLRKKANPGRQADMKSLLGELQLNTVCQQALCPNISECFSCGQATFLIMGRNCTRLCSFCNVEKGIPEQLDRDEPARVAEAVGRLKLTHVVITSPTRDDLSDGGAAHFAATVSAVRAVRPATKIELLVPDFAGDSTSLQMVLDAAPDILAHNLETVPRLYHIRSGADYSRSLNLIRACHDYAAGIPVKSGLMLGLGEESDEVLDALRDLYEAGCTYLSLGQYLAPSRRHRPVVEYIPPEHFIVLRDEALKIGFRHVESGPYVRSSYHADRYA